MSASESVARRSVAPDSRGATVEVLEGRQALQRVREEWGWLQACSPAATAFTAREWVEPWCDLAEPRAIPNIWLVRDRQGMPAALLVLVRRRRWEDGGWTELVFPGSGPADVQDLVLAPAADWAVAPLSEELSSRRQPELLRLAALPVDSPLLASLSRATDRMLVRPPATLVMARRPDADYRPTKSRRKDLRRLMRSVGTQEGLQLRSVTGEFDASEWVERLAEVEARSPKLRRGQTLFDSSARGKFHRAMLHAFARQGRLILVSLSSGSELCAFAFGLRHSDTAYGYGTAYDSRYKAAAPGVVALRAFVASCFDTGCQEVSLGRGHSHAKHRLAGEQRTLHTLLHFRRPLARHAARMLLVARDRWRSQASRGGHPAWKRG